MMDDLFGADAWGEEPDWAKEDEGSSSPGGDNGDGSIMALVGAQHVVCLVDCHADMFDVNRDGDASSSIDMTLQLIDELLQQRIRTTVTMKTGKRDGVGVILYHTKPSRNKSCMKQDQENHVGRKDMDEDHDDDNEEEDHDDDEGSTVHVLLPLTPPGSSTVRTIRACFQKDPVHGGRIRDLQQEFAFEKGSNDGTDTPLRLSPLQTALQECLRTFQSSKCVKQQHPAAGSSSVSVSAVDTKSVWIFTNRDHPYPDQSHLIQNVARDVHEHGIEIITWPLLHPQQQDSVTFRHDRLLESIATSIPFVDRLTTQDECLDALEALQQYWKKLRRSFCCPLLLPGAKGNVNASSSIYVDWFRFVQMAKKPNRVPINQQTKRETLKVRQLIDDTGSIFATFKPGGNTSSAAAKPPGLQRLRSYAKFGDELIPISTDDVMALKKTATADKEFGGLTLLGFQPRNNTTIPWYHMTDSAYLIYPSEDLNNNSNNTGMNQAAFCHLHASMLRKGVLAMGEVLHRVQWTSRLVAIYPIDPSDGVLDDNNEQEPRPAQPPGMMVITLPFEDDMRALELDAAMKELLVEQTSTIFKGEPDLADPAVKMEPDMIESNDNATGDENENKGNIASEELVQATVDLIGRQRLEGMELGKDFENAALTEFFNYLESVALEVPLGEEEEDFDTRIDDQTILDAALDQIKAVVKLLPEDVEISKATGARKRKLLPDDSGLEWEDLYRTDALADCKVPDLKKYLRSVGEPLSGNKGAVVLRVTHHLREQLEKQRNVKVAVKKE